MRKFDENYWRSVAIELNHRGAIPTDMESRWDAQGAFVAGARCLFERLQQINQTAIDAKAMELSQPILRSMISRGQAFDSCIEMAKWILESLQPENLTEPDVDESRTARCGSECKSQPDGEIAHLSECRFSDEYLLSLVTDSGSESFGNDGKHSDVIDGWPTRHMLMPLGSQHK